MARHATPQQNTLPNPTSPILSLPEQSSPNYFDHPILSPSISAREAVREDATPGAMGKKYDRAPAGRPGVSRNNSYSYTSKDNGYLHSGYFDTVNKRPDSQPRAYSDDLRSGVASPIIPEIQLDLSLKPTTEIRAGLVQKSFHIHTDLLVSKSPYFAALQKPEIVTTTNSTQRSTEMRLSGPFFFPHIDEFAFALFVRWIYGGRLHGPADFHSMNHYVCLYVLARDFHIEALKNNIMDLVRHYYHRENMTAPAYRLDYIYSFTDGPCLMREFLITTAAYRVLSDSDKGGMMTESIKGVLVNGGDVAPDFANALCKLFKNDRADVRKGDNCQWHEHHVTDKCIPAPGLEPFQSE